MTTVSKKLYRWKHTWRRSPAESCHCPAGLCSRCRPPSIWSQCETCKNNDELITSLKVLKNNDDLNSSLEVHLMICSHNVRCVDLEIFSRIVTLFVVKIASDAGQALKSGVLVMHGPKDQKLNYYNQGRQFWWLMHSELPTSGMPTSRQFWGRQYKGLPPFSWWCFILFSQSIISVSLVWTVNMHYSIDKSNEGLIWL